MEHVTDAEKESLSSDMRMGENSSVELWGKNTTWKVQIALGLLITGVIGTIFAYPSFKGILNFYTALKNIEQGLGSNRDFYMKQTLGSSDVLWWYAMATICISVIIMALHLLVSDTEGEQFFDPLSGGRPWLANTLHCVYYFITIPASAFFWGTICFVVGCMVVAQ